MEELTVGGSGYNGDAVRGVISFSAYAEGAGDVEDTLNKRLVLCYQTLLKVCSALKKKEIMNISSSYPVINFIIGLLILLSLTTLTEVRAVPLWVAVWKKNALLLFPQANTVVVPCKENKCDFSIKCIFSSGLDPVMFLVFFQPHLHLYMTCRVSHIYLLFLKTAYNE